MLRWCVSYILSFSPRDCCNSSTLVFGHCTAPKLGRTANGAARLSTSLSLMMPAIRGTGSEAVEWMVSKGVTRSVGEAVNLGNALLEYGLLAHVVRAASEASTSTR